MAISLSTTLTPFMGRGQPRVVITGWFTPGFVHEGPVSGGVATGGSQCGVGTWLSLAGLAVSVPGRQFSLKVSGRPMLPADVTTETGAPYLWDGTTIPDYEASGLTSIVRSRRTGLTADYTDTPDLVRMANSFIVVSDPETQVHSRSTLRADWVNLEMSLTAARTYMNSGSNRWKLPEIWLHRQYQGYRIELTGAVAELDLRVLAAAALIGWSNYQCTLDLVSPVDPSDSYMERFAGYYIAESLLMGASNWMGWRTDSVHIVDQPWLRGHVLGANLAEQGVVWD